MRDDTKYNRLIKAVTDKIRSGACPPGSKLPGQLAMAKEYDVSPITSERALRELERLGLARRIARSGSYVPENPRLISEIIMLLPPRWSGAEPPPQITDYINGAMTGAAEAGVPCHIIGFESVSPQDTGAEMFAGRGVIFLAFEDAPLMGLLKKAGTPFVCAGIDARTADLCAVEDRRKAAAALTRAMRSCGAKRIVCAVNMSASNHRAVKEGYLAAAESEGFEPLVIDANDGNIAVLARQLLNGAARPDAFIIMGAQMPVAALAALMEASPRPMLGVFSENSTVLQLKETAFVAEYSQTETGKNAVGLLLSAAAGKITHPAVFLTPSEIRVPPLFRKKQRSP
jgi:DNA-binding LacI/PurR family transcriptional regulator